MEQFNLFWVNNCHTTTGVAIWLSAWEFVKFRVGESDTTFDGVNSSVRTIRESSAANLRVSMPVAIVCGNGALAANTIVGEITNATQFQVIIAPIKQRSFARIECRCILEHAILNKNIHKAPAVSFMEVGLLFLGSAYYPIRNLSTGVSLYRNLPYGRSSLTLKKKQLNVYYGTKIILEKMLLTMRESSIETVCVPGGVNLNVVPACYFQGGFTNTVVNNAVSNPILGFPTGIYSPLVAIWPNGCNTQVAFYRIKYEMRIGQNHDFFEYTNLYQKVNRTANAPNSADGKAAFSNNNRNGIDACPLY